MPAWIDCPPSLLGVSAVGTYSLGKGRKKAVRKFTARQGLWMAMIIGAGMLGMLLLFLLGFFHMD
jgi:Na+-driven multidrug efflux pump